MQAGHLRRLVHHGFSSAADEAASSRYLPPTLVSEEEPVDLLAIHGYEHFDACDTRGDYLHADGRPLRQPLVVNAFFGEAPKCVRQNLLMVLNGVGLTGVTGMPLNGNGKVVGVVVAMRWDCRAERMPRTSIW